MKNYTSKDLLLDEQTERQIEALRRARYNLFRQTHNLSLVDITDEELVFLYRKSEIYEQLTGTYLFEIFVDFYKKTIADEKFLETGTSYAAFLRFVNHVLSKDCSSKRTAEKRMVHFFTSGKLEELLGEEAVYDGELALIRAYNEKQIKEELKKAFTKLKPNEVEAMEEVVMNGMSQTDLSKIKSSSSETIRQYCVKGLRKIRRSKYLKILRDYNETPKEETSLLDLTFVEEKNK